MCSQASVILSTIGLMATGSLLILVMARSVRILLECFLVTFVSSRPGSFQLARQMISSAHLFKNW